MDFEHLKLSNQLCFPIYAASRLITRLYQPYLEKLGITYPQYIVLMVLWETDAISVNEICNKLLLNTNTLTPLLKRMETSNFITRSRSENDERKVVITLTEKGNQLKTLASAVPIELFKELQNSNLTTQELIELRNTLNRLIDFLKNKA